jgi:hypothetical protein
MGNHEVKDHRYFSWKLRAPEKFWQDGYEFQRRDI